MKPSRRRVPFAALVAGIVILGLCCLLGLNTAAAADELKRNKIAAKQAEVEAQIEELTREIATTQAPNALAEAAAKIGMVPAPNPAFMVIGANSKVTVRGVPKPVPATPAPTPSGPPPGMVPIDGTPR